MSIRVKVFLIITSIVGAVTVSVIAVSIFFSQAQMLRTVEKDMNLVAELADELIAYKINLLKADASLIAAAIQEAPENGAAAALEREIGAFSEFAAAAVFSLNRKVTASYGENPAADDLFNSAFVQRAFAGEQSISTTRIDSSGRLVMYVCVPLGYQALALTIPGFTFSDILSKFSIWNSGSIFIIDRQGVIIASAYEDMVRQRFNVIEQGKLSPAEWGKTGEFFAGVVQGGDGVGIYSFRGEPRVCAFMPITGIGTDWFLGVAAPIKESPATRIQQLLMLSALLFFGLGVMVAFFASGSIARPFEQLHAQNTLLAELKEAAQQSSEAKSRFLANMSHEMRTPLNAIIGLSELILGSGLSKNAETNLEKIYASGITLLGIVNDLLDISKIEAGKFEIIPAEYDLSSLINDTINLNIIRIGSKPVSFQLLIDETLPSRLYGDELRIKQIFNNLLSNAFKYTNSGSVVWKVSCQEEGGFVWLTTSVKDTGIGIKAEEKEKLFADYSRLDKLKTRKLEGTGLGLVITKMIADLMEGEVSVDSEYGKGSTFTVKIKQRSVDAPPVGPAAAANLSAFSYSSQKRGRNAGIARVKLPYARVLVADDVPVNLDVARGMLQPYGMDVDCVLGGRDAVEAVKKENPRYDAVFMDHMMPGIDGIEAARLIRGLGTDYAKKIPIIVLTANAIAGNEEMFLSRGFNDFLSKPIDIMRLDAVIHRWVRDKTKEKDFGAASPDDALIDKALEAVNAPPAIRAIPVPGVSAIPAVPKSFEQWHIAGLNIAKALARFGGIESALTGALRSYSVHTAKLIEALRVIPTRDADGGELEISEDLLKRYTIAVHSAKGASYGICADDAGKMAENLEKAARSGDTGFISANNEALINALQKLASELSRALEKTMPSPRFA